VLSDRLKWLQRVGCLRRDAGTGRYHLTAKSLDLHATAMMAIDWERRHYRTPFLDDVALVHTDCGQPFTPAIACRSCGEKPSGRDVRYLPGPGATRDRRSKKVRRRSTLPAQAVPSPRSVYRNLVDIVGDRWTANVIALAFHGHARFDAFHRELPVATNILSERLRFLEQHGILAARVYQQRPQRQEYRLTHKGRDLFPFFLTLLHWGDVWCDPHGHGPPMLLEHTRCGQALVGEVRCDQCAGALAPFAVSVRLP